MPGDAPLVALDANALDRDGGARDALVDGFLALVAEGRVRAFLPSGVAAEMRDPRAPAAVRAAAAALSSPAPRAPERAPGAQRHIDRIRVRAVMRGDGRPGKHDADAGHLSEAAEAGCDHFLTGDGKILRRRDALRPMLPPGLRVGTLAEFMAGFGPDG